MSIKSLITDPSTGIQASVVDGEEKSAVVVATRPLKVFENKIEFFTNIDYGYNMNVEAGFSGTPEYIHNGTDNIYWTASAVVGGWVFNSADQAHTGTKSIDATSVVDSDVAQVVKGSSINLTDKVAITGWIYITEWSDKGTKKIYLFGWDTTTALLVGNVVDLKNYIDMGLIGVWQKFAISLSDVGLVNEIIDAIRIKIVDIGPGNAPKCYFDDIQIEETGERIEFNIVPNESTWLHVNTYSIFIADACTSVLADATMPYFSYDKLLGMSALSTGILYQTCVGRKITLSFPFRDLGDILMFPGATIGSHGSDGTNTFLKILVDLKEPIILKPENEDRISFVVSDNLSPLLKLVISANCKEETRLC